MTDTAEQKPIDKMSKAELVEHITKGGPAHPAYGWAPGLDYDANIFERLAGIGSDVGAMEKRPVQNFKAFTVDDVYSKLRPLFTKWGVAVLPRIRSIDYVDRSEPKTDQRGNVIGDRTVIDARVVLEYVFAAPDGSSTSITFGAEGRDYQDKATNKAVQQAFKYGLIQMFMISTGEVDPDAEAIEVTAATKTAEVVSNEPVDAPPKPTAAEKRMNKIKIAAWGHTEGTREERIVEATAIVEQSLAVYGRDPKNQADVDAILSNIEEMFEEKPEEKPEDEPEDDGSGYA